MHSYVVWDVWTLEPCGANWYTRKQHLWSQSEPDCACNSVVDVSLGDMQLVCGPLTASHNSGINAKHIKTLCWQEMITCGSSWMASGKQMDNRQELSFMSLCSCFQRGMSLSFCATLNAIQFSVIKRVSLPKLLLVLNVNNQANINCSQKLCVYKEKYTNKQPKSCVICVRQYCRR